jgi:hypothetical protein
VDLLLPKAEAPLPDPEEGEGDVAPLAPRPLVERVHDLARDEEETRHPAPVKEGEGAGLTVQKQELAEVEESDDLKRTDQVVRRRAGAGGIGSTVHPAAPRAPAASLR